MLYSDALPLDRLVKCRNKYFFPSVSHVLSTGWHFQSQAWKDCQREHLACFADRSTTQLGTHPVQPWDTSFAFTRIECEWDFPTSRPSQAPLPRGQRSKAHSISWTASRVLSLSRFDHGSQTEAKKIKEKYADQAGPSAAFEATPEFWGTSGRGIAVNHLFSEVGNSHYGGQWQARGHSHMWSDYIGRGRARASTCSSWQCDPQQMWITGSLAVKGPSLIACFPGRVTKRAGGTVHNTSAGNIR